MEQTKYTKNQLVEAFETYRKSTEIFNDICRSIEPVVENAVNAGVEKAKGIQFMKDEAGTFLTLKKPNTIISPVFKSFIELYFVNETRLATIKRSELTKEEIEDSQWEIIKDYRREGDTEWLCHYLDVDALDGCVIRLRLEPDNEDLATIYEAEDFTINEEDGFITVRAGETLLARIDPKTEME